MGFYSIYPSIPLYITYTHSCVRTRDGRGDRRGRLEGVGRDVHGFSRKRLLPPLIVAAAPPPRAAADVAAAPSTIGRALGKDVDDRDLW